MRRTLAVLSTFALFLSVLSGCKTPQTNDPEAARSDVLYSCGCGPQCTCGTVSMGPGKCQCGKDLVWTHAVKREGVDVLLCSCSEGCTCASSSADPTKCGCGKTLKKISLKGTGVYFCNCGDSCNCNTISAEPGQCACGKELSKAD